MIITSLYYTIPNQVSSKMQKEIALLAADDAVANIGVTESDKDNFGPAIKKYLESVDIEEGNSW